MKIKYINSMARANFLAKRNLFLYGGFAALLGIICSGCATSAPGIGLQKKIAQKTYVIIGASSGFGRGVAEKLGSYGAKVIIAARRGEALEEVAHTVRSNGGTAITMPMDISKPADLAKIQALALKEFGHVDVWINMAGVGAIGRFWEIPIADQARIVEINLTGFIYASHAAITIFKNQGFGTLINMGSIESINPLAYHASYSATKAGVLNLSKTIGQELRLAGYDRIKVVTIEPWAVDTPFWRHAANYSGGTPRMAAIDPPSKVVNAVIRASIRPRRELSVGWKAKGAKFSHWLLPGFTERISANIAHRYQIRKAPPADTTSGSVFKPMKEGTGVDDGVRKRIKKEKELQHKH
ncbi:short-subunit dehydrogenase [Pedobacter sp. W3I1]|uniref:SDR family NAD(P)-dependent oxidoreductase n=1 Tax=Pedobacter sp. W3I1 TaxID=3042291 RepID=UPI002787AE5E|nr:SDR family NAD(P)-dependent oxidoreductase [Pedobacter sp. W3I1]MDQ0641190.1 short-subunit dehydrogenase [Pedobacter sp. W3I1]